MEFRVIDRKNLDIPAWEKLTATSSFFHSHQWVDTCVGGLSPGAHGEFLCGYENGHLVAGMPAVITKIFGMKSFYSMPYGTYGEVVMAEGAGGAQRDEFYVHLVKYLKKGRFSRIAITDFDRNFSRLSEPFLSHSESFTHIINLNGDGPHLPPDKSIDRHIRAGLKADTRIVEISTRDHVKEFYNIYEMTEKRHGSIRPLYSKHFFNSILKHLGGTDILYWKSLMYNDRMVGSGIKFIYHDTLFSWQMVSDYEYRHLKPNHVLMFDAIQAGNKAGIKKINLGSSPIYAHSLIDYKERWGGEKVEYDTYISDSWLRRLLSSK
ncbi:MAG: GNAT family N-acetyltransferase [Candidatus Krumholzibacteria bacterium]|nr:GNAT family N-acetyltransferase [Candidatus Krumholzibacteria bacterium]